MRPLLAAVATLALASSLLAAQSAANAAAPQAVTRRDLADAYLLVDRVAAERSMPAAQRARWNEDFDRTTLAFFGGDFAKVLRDMHDLTARMLGDSAAASPTRRLLALRLRPLPRVLTPEASEQRVVVTVMYAAEAEMERLLRLRVIDASGQRHAAGTLRIPAGVRAGDSVVWVVPRVQLPQRNMRLQLRAELDGAALPLTAPLFALEIGADSLRAFFEREVAGLPVSADQQTLASLRARIALLADVPDEANSAQFLADPVALAAALQEEVAAVAAGRDPYRRTGDLWRILQLPSGRVPMRVYVPPQARTTTNLPLVIALHGAGADENVFFDAYGHGRLRALADSLGFIAVAPSTLDFARDPAVLDSTLALIERSNPFDRRRVYILGHSLGAGVALRFAAQRGDILRAAALIAGAGTVAADQALVPTLFLAAERDLVIPAARVRASYDALRARGAPVEFALAADWGHTLVVGAELDRVLRFLFSR